MGRPILLSLQHPLITSFSPIFKTLMGEIGFINKPKPVQKLLCLLGMILFDGLFALIFMVF